MKVEHIHRIAMALAGNYSLIEMANLVVTECKAALKADAVCIYILQDNDLYEMLAERGCTEEFKRQWRRFPKEVLPLTKLEDPLGSLFLGNADEFKKELPEAAHLVKPSKRHSIAYAPLVVNRKPIGVLGFSYNTSPQDPIHRDYIITLVNLCGQALERVRLTEQERKVREDAEGANKAKTEFLTNISHEIRTPIGIIQGFADLLAKSPRLSEEERRWISTLRRNSMQLTSIIGQVLDISKIEASQIVIERISFCMKEFIEDLKSTISLRALEKNIELSFKCGPLPPRIYSDPNRLRQILINLIGNAIKFTPCGRVEVDIAFTPSNLLQILVTDTGIGIPLHAHQAIFEPFFQAEASTSRQFGGTGLGLSISKNLAEALGGELRLVHSSPGKGSIFIFEMQCELPTTVQTEHPPPHFSGQS